MPVPALLMRDWRSNPLRWLMWAGAAGLLLLPAVAMRFTPEVAWTSSDFVFMGALLAAAGLAVEVGMRLPGDGLYRAGVLVAVGGAILMLWANAAVGLIGSEANPANLLYLGVIAVAVVGAIAARMRPRGLAAAMGAALALHAAIGIAALALGWSERPLQMMGVTMGFALPWAMATLLFMASARRAGAMR